MLHYLALHYLAMVRTSLCIGSAYYRWQITSVM
jgi:hypothetical protein